MRILKSTITLENLNTSLERTGLLCDEEIDGMYTVNNMITMQNKDCCASSYEAFISRIKEEHVI